MCKRVVYKSFEEVFGETIKFYSIDIKKMI